MASTFNAETLLIAGRRVRPLLVLPAGLRDARRSQVEAVFVTAVYADPLQLERLFVKVGGSRPLVVFSHGLSLSRES